MATKTLTFKFIKKAKFKLSKDNYVNKEGFTFESVYSSPRQSKHPIKSYNFK